MAPPMAISVLSGDRHYYIVSKYAPEQNQTYDR